MDKQTATDYLYNQLQICRDDCERLQEILKERNQTIDKLTAALGEALARIPVNPGISAKAAYNSGAEAMREAFLELLTQSVRSLRAPGETTDAS